MVKEMIGWILNCLMTQYFDWRVSRQQCKRSNPSSHPNFAKGEDHFHFLSPLLLWQSTTVLEQWPFFLSAGCRQETKQLLKSHSIKLNAKFASWPLREDREASLIWPSIWKLHLERNFELVLAICLQRILSVHTKECCLNRVSSTRSVKLMQKCKIHVQHPLFASENLKEKNKKKKALNTLPVFSHVLAQLPQWGSLALDHVNH